MRQESPSGRRHSGAPRDRIIGWLADVQHGVVTRCQLLEAGLSSEAIGRALAAGRLRPVFRGVYAVGHLALRREGWLMAALLACGPDSAISHRTAGVALGIEGGPMFPIHVTTRTDRGRKQERLSVHRQCLVPQETCDLDGLRVTTAPRTIVDRAGSLDGRGLRHLVERAQDRRLFDPKAMAAVLNRHPGRSGTRALKSLIQLMQPDRDKARSHLERLFLSAIRATRLPRPEVNHPINGKKRDFVWLDERLVVEVDGYAYHSSRAAKRRDHRRDRQLTGRGWRPVRFTYEDVALEPTQAMEELAELLVTAATH